jgi:hypothetical protein
MVSCPASAPWSRWPSIAGATDRLHHAVSRARVRRIVLGAGYQRRIDAVTNAQRRLRSTIMIAPTVMPTNDTRRVDARLRAGNMFVLRVTEIFLCAVSLLAASGWGALAYDELATARVVAVPPMPQPGYLQPVTDPIFGTDFTRITDPGRRLGAPGVACSLAYCTHRYSSSQAWNADQSLLVIVNGCSGFCFLDGQTYKPLFHRRASNECEWHPTDPMLMICVYGNEIYTWAPRIDAKTTIYAGYGYRNFQFGPYKGNPSKDGNMLVVRATNTAGALVAFAYEMSTRRKYPDIRLADLSGSNGYCTISPSGRFVFCSQHVLDGTNTAYVFTVDGVQVQHWTEHHRPGHGDMTIDADGSDVYVGISKANPDKYHIIKRRLEDGVVTNLAPYGEGQHASVRNINRPGWAFITYTGTYSGVAARLRWAPFYQEVIALSIGASGELRRIVQTRNPKYDYWSETHASPSPDGSQVIWSSNWGQVGGSVADYVARLSWPEPASAKSSP